MSIHSRNAPDPINETQRLKIMCPCVMMNKKSHRITHEVKADIIHRIKEEGIPVAQATKEHGIHETTIYGWMDLVNNPPKTQKDAVLGILKVSNQTVTNHHVFHVSKSYTRLCTAPMDQPSLGQPASLPISDSSPAGKKRIR